MMRDLQELEEDLDVSLSVKARVATATVEDAETTQDLAPKVPTVKATRTRAEGTMEEFSEETAEVKEAVGEAKEEAREETREVVQEVELQDTTTTMTDTITTTKEEDLRLLVVAQEITTITMKTELVEDTTIKIMTIPAKIEWAVATTTMVVEEDLLNNKTIMIMRAAMTTEDLSKTEETTTIKTIVQMMIITDLLEIIDLIPPDLIIMRATVDSQGKPTEEALEEETAEVSSEETEVAIVVATLEVHQEETLEMVTILEAMVANADKVVATMGLEELALINYEGRKF